MNKLNNKAPSTTIGDCIHSATPFQMGLLFENMQILVTHIKYQLLASDALAGCAVLCGSEKYEMPSGKDITPQMLFKEPSDIAGQIFWATGLSTFTCFVEWWFDQPSDDCRDDDGHAWYDLESISRMWNMYLIEQEP